MFKLKTILFRGGLIHKIYKVNSHKWICRTIYQNKCIREFVSKTKWELDIHISSNFCFMKLPQTPLDKPKNIYYIIK
jgi:hypothetical protein